MAAMGRIIAFAILLAGALGCGRGIAWEGNWIGTRNLPVQPGTDQAITNTLRRVELRLLANGSFELIDGGIPRSGSWNASGERATLVTHALMGRPVPGGRPLREATLQANDDGTLTLTDPEGLSQEPLRLERQKA